MAAEAVINDDALTAETVEHLRTLVRFDTTNPSGNETPAAEHIAGVLRRAGIEPEVAGPAPERGSVVARLRAATSGEGEPALLLHAHLDVVPAREADGWTHGPFSGDLVDGCVWGRGAVDNKSGVALLLTAFLALHRSGARLRRDVIFAATADEEAGGHMGAGWLVDHRPELLDATYCLGEGGGYGSFLGGHRFYPISVAEKGSCMVRVRAHGPAGHGAIPVPDNAILTLAAALQRLSRSLPHHRVASVDSFLAGVARLVGGAQGAFLGQLARSGRGARLIAAAAERGETGQGSVARQLNAMLRNTVSPTMLEAGLRDNVIPAEARATLDARLLPGQTPETLLAELRAAIGPRLAKRVDFEIAHAALPVEGVWASPLADVLSGVMGRHDPDAPVLPFMLGAVTDAKHLTRLPSMRHYYGFHPLRAPRDFSLVEQLHAVDERVPVEALAFGTLVMVDVLREFCAYPA